MLRKKRENKDEAKRPQNVPALRNCFKITKPIYTCTYTSLSNFWQVWCAATILHAPLPACSKSCGVATQLCLLCLS
jgi:hypothetical protein